MNNLLPELLRDDSRKHLEHDSDPSPFVNHPEFLNSLFDCPAELEI